MALSSNTQKVIKIVVRSRRSFNDNFILYAANLSKNESFIPVSYELVEVTPDVGYQKQYEILYTFVDLLIGQNILTIRLIGQDGIDRTSTYIVTRTFPHEESTVSVSTDTLPTIYNPIPAHGAVNVERVMQLHWSVYDPEGNPIVFDVFFGKSETPNLVSEDQMSIVYPATADLKLDAGNTYAWKIRAKEQSIGGGIVESPTWIFRAAYSPDVPNSPLPVLNAIEIDPTNVTLYWESQSYDGNPLTYDVYFGPTSSPPKITVVPISANFINVGALVPNTIYYWKIVVSDNKYSTVPGPKWKFKTSA